MLIFEYFIYTTVRNTGLLILEVYFINIYTFVVVAPIEMQLLYKIT